MFRLGKPHPQGTGAGWHGQKDALKKERKRAEKIYSEARKSG
jgi:hypothetical protein